MIGVVRLLKNKNGIGCYSYSIIFARTLSAQYTLKYNMTMLIDIYIDIYIPVIERQREIEDPLFPLWLPQT